MTQVHPENSPPTSADRGSSANHIPISINLGGVTLIVVVFLVAIIGTTGVVMGIDISDRQAQQREFDNHQRTADRLADDREHRLEEAFLKLDRQYRMTELKLDDWSVVAHRAGLKLPGDYTRGPQGNLDSDSFHLQEKDHGRRRDNQPAGSR